MTDKETLREAGAVAICKVLSPCSGFCHSPRCAVAIESYGDAMDAAIATMFERLRTPSEGMIKFAEQRIYETSDTTRMFAHGRAHAAFQIVVEAFQQDNSDATS